MLLFIHVQDKLRVPLATHLNKDKKLKGEKKGLPKHNKLVEPGNKSQPIYYVTVPVNQFCGRILM